MKQINFLQKKVLIPTIIAIGMATVFADGYFIIQEIQNYKKEIITQGNTLKAIINTVTFQQEELEILKEKLETTQNINSAKSKELEKTIATEKENRAIETKNLKEKIQQVEIKSIATESIRKAQEEIAQKKISTLEEKVSQTKTYNVASIISKWRPIIANVECQFRYSDTGRLYQENGGSGIVLKFGNTPGLILTNKHVITDDGGYGAYSCSVKLPDSSELITSSDTRSSAKGYDLGYIYINNPSSYLQTLTSTFPSLCSQKPLLGDEIVVLGYPSIGSKENVTATEGIVSGFDGNYIVTSAKVEQGNSGGAAILLKDNCLLGIPTFVTLGKVESLARILDIWIAVDK